MLIELKHASLAHIELIIAIGKETFYESFKNENTEENMKHYLAKAFTSEKISAELNNPHSRFYLLFVDEQLAGYLKVNTYSAQSENMGDEALEVERIYLKKSFQKLGLGKVLMDKAIDIAVEESKTIIWLGVWEKNENAIAFYSKAGFEKSGKKIFYMGDEQQTDFIMKKTLRG